MSVCVCVFIAAGALLDKKWDSSVFWSAARMAHHGWGFLQANASHLSWQMFRNNGPELVDYFIKPLRPQQPLVSFT